MTNPNQDTDPSTPGAKRQSDPRTPEATPADVGPNSTMRARPTTDPGIAPPGPMLPASNRPMGIVVPPVGVLPGLNDSVDVLLDGISREFPDRPRATSHSDGHSAATYHAEHVIRAPDRASPRHEPKVVIERPSMGQTARVARYAGPVDEDAKEWTETTAIRKHSVTSRVLIALIAGVVVVVAIFVALQRTSNGRFPLLTSAPAPASPALAAPAIPAPLPSVQPVVSLVPAPGALPPPGAPGSLDPRAAIGAASPTAVDTSGAGTAVAAENLPTASDGSRKPAGSPARASRPKAKAAASASKAPSSDLGEFKTSF